MAGLKFGLLSGLRGEFSWNLGANSPVVHKELNPNKDWLQYRAEHEIQFNYEHSYDTLMCVSYSANNCLETLMMYYLSNNLIEPEKVRWLTDSGYFTNGFINFSDRYVGINGKTTSQGAYMFNVARGLENNGGIPQSMFGLADNFKDNIDYKFITVPMIDLGREFLKNFTINYEWLDNVSEGLKYGPVQVSVVFQNGDEGTILSPTGTPNHAVSVLKEEADCYVIWDHYSIQLKRYAKDKVFSPMLYSITINNINMDIAKFIDEHDLYWVQNSNTGQFGRIMRDKLYVVNSDDRAALILLDDKMRTEKSVKVTNNEWLALPKINF